MTLGNYRSQTMAISDIKYVMQLQYWASSVQMNDRPILNLIKLLLSVVAQKSQLFPSRQSENQLVNYWNMRIYTLLLMRSFIVLDSSSRSSFSIGQ